MRPLRTSNCCALPHWAKSFCKKHYERWKRQTDPEFRKRRNKACLKWQQKNLDFVAVTHYLYYHSNPIFREKSLINAKKRYIQQPKKLKQQMQQWYKKNKEYKRLYSWANYILRSVGKK